MKIKFIIYFFLLTLYACTNTNKRYHDGTYVYIDALRRTPNEQQITIDGQWMYHSIQSIKDKANFKEHKFICIQYPDKIPLPLQDGHSVTVEIDSAGNINYDGHLFIKEPMRIIDLTPIPRSFQENQQ